MKNIIIFIKKIPRVYYILIFISTIWISFLDADRFFTVRTDQSSTIKQLTKDREYYKTKIENDKKRIKELTTDNENLEKFAREKYMMKGKNEDVFIIIDLKDKKD